MCSASWEPSSALPRRPDATRVQFIDYMGTSFIRKRTLLGPYRMPRPRVLGESWGGGRFLVGEVPLYETSMITFYDPLRWFSCAAKIWVHLTHYTWLKKGDAGANTVEHDPSIKSQLGSRT